VSIEEWKDIQASVIGNRYVPVASERALGIGHDRCGGFDQSDAFEKLDGIDRLSRPQSEAIDIPKNLHSWSRYWGS
jgi:hypothetical protein